jgi:putative colanic acid biosynthesis acetyltransferase WcaB
VSLNIYQAEEKDNKCRFSPQGINRIFQDWEANPKNVKSRLILTLFRLAQEVRNAWRPLFVLGIPYLIFYRVIVEWTFGIELPWNTTVGRGLRLFHGQALVVNDQTIIGSGCTLRQGTTIGNKALPTGGFTACPRIGDNVDIGANAIIIGPITIGDNSVIGAGAVVTKDVPEGVTVIGNPARVLSRVDT